jgi:hypothetical protein
MTPARRSRVEPWQAKPFRACTQPMLPDVQSIIIARQEATYPYATGTLSPRVNVLLYGEAESQTQRSMA